jgi:hypothetical protein
MPIARILHQIQTLRGEIFRSIGDANIFRMAVLQPLRADGGGNHSTVRRHGFVDLQTRSASHQQRYYRNRRFPEPRPDVGNGTSHRDPFVIGKRFYRRWWSATYDREGRRRTFAANDRKNFFGEPQHALLIGQPVHGADKYEIRSRSRIRRNRGWRKEFEIDARGNCRYMRNSERFTKGLLINLSARHHVPGFPARRALKFEHPVSLQSEKIFAQCSFGMLCMAPPDHELDVVLEQHAVRAIRKVAHRREMIHHRAIEAFAANQIIKEFLHSRRVKPAHRKRLG